MKKHRRRKVGRRTSLLTPISHALAPLQAHPVRASLLAAIGLVLVSLIVTKSLPFVLAPTNPDLALALNPNNPAALIAKAERLRNELLAASKIPQEVRSSKVSSADAQTIDKLPRADGKDVEDTPGDVDRLRLEIRRLALRTIANDPLNAEAFRLWAETITDYGETRSLMVEAARRSRRDSVALFWLLNDSYYRKDFAAALDYSDLLLRTHPELSSFVFSYLARIAEEPGGAERLVPALAEGPSWRVSFFNALPDHIKQTGTPLKLMAALKESGKPPSNKELAPYLAFLLRKNAVAEAYNAWLQFLPAGELDTLGLLTNAKFEREPSGLSFDWRIARGLNAVAEFAPLGTERARALHVSFAHGRVQFPEVSQIVLLPAGKYRLTGKLKGSIVGKRGLRWQLRCLGGPRKVLGETEMLMGKSNEWRIFELEAEVVQADDCRGQELRLFHDSRSASEELLDGEAWFADLHLERQSEALSQ